MTRLQKMMRAQLLRPPTHRTTITTTGKTVELRTLDPTRGRRAETQRAPPCTGPQVDRRLVALQFRPRRPHLLTLLLIIHVGSALHRWKPVHLLVGHVGRRRHVERAMQGRVILR